MDLGVKAEGTTKTANRRREVFRLLLPKPGASPELKIQSTLKDMCVWQGKEFPSNALPPEQVGAPQCAERFDSKNGHTVSNDSGSMNS